MEDLPDLEDNLLFNNCGECQCTHDVEAQFSQISGVFDMSDDLLINVRDVVESSRQPRTSTGSDIDCEALQPKFGWLPVDIIKHMFEKTTQFYCAPISQEVVQVHMPSL